MLNGKQRTYLQWITKQQLSFNSDSSSSEEDFDVRGPIALRPRIENYIEEVVNLYTDAEFRENFRMNRFTFNYVLSLIENDISTNIYEKGRHTISAKTQLLITLWYFGTPDSFRSICSRFNIGKATALGTVRRTANALVSLGNSIIAWPTGERLNEIKHGFAQMGFPDTIGCIDGMHVRIPMPKDHGISYINRKNFPSGVCDHTLKFTHCYAGEVGSNHDATVLRRSEIWSYIIDREVKFPNNTHLIGDKAYPCLPQLITPYKDNGHLTNEQKTFNFLLSSTRTTIERAFGLLQKRFRCVKDLLDVRCIEWASKYIISCCILHNICIMQNDILQLEVVPNEDEDNNVGEQIRGIHREELRLGIQKRNRLCRELNTPNIN